MNDKRLIAFFCVKSFERSKFEVEEMEMNRCIDDYFIKHAGIASFSYQTTNGNTAFVNIIHYTSAFHAAISQNVWCEKRSK